jgi:hypothetical protein
MWRDSMALGTASVEAIFANGQDLWKKEIASGQFIFLYIVEAVWDENRHTYLEISLEIFESHLCEELKWC